MKKLLCIAIALFSVSVMADSDRLTKRKAVITETITKRIQILTEKKTCITSAKDKNGIKACNTAAREKMKAITAARKAQRADRKASRKN